MELTQVRRLALRPSGHTLMMLLRAAVPDAGDAGPWLLIERTQSAPPVYVHHATCADVPPYSPHRLVMLSGHDALAYATDNQWRSITSPTRAQLMELSLYALVKHDVYLWAQDYAQWATWYVSKAATDERALTAREHAARARALRWTLAEQWLRA